MLISFNSASTRSLIVALTNNPTRNIISSSFVRKHSNISVVIDKMASSDEGGTETIINCNYNLK